MVPAIVPFLGDAIPAYPSSLLADRSLCLLYRHQPFFQAAQSPDADSTEQGSPMSPLDESAALIFDEVDKNSDGEMTEAEFTAWADLNQDRANEFLRVLDEKDFEASAGRCAGITGGLLP